MKHEYLATSLWCKEKIKDPYQVIAEFFSAADIAWHRKRIKEILMVACSNHSWQKDNPGDLLCDFKLIESIINATYLINKEKKKNPLEISVNGMLNKNLYCGLHSGSTEWDFLPRSLSRKEYINPYLTFRRFFKYLKLYEWKQKLSYLLDHALVNTSLFEAGIEMDVLSTYFQLTKLIEAAHLIDVREITHIGGHIKNRIIK